MAYRLIFDDTDDEVTVDSSDIPRVGDHYWATAGNEATHEGLRDKSLVDGDDFYLVRKVARDLTIYSVGDGLEGVVGKVIEVYLTRDS